jgi:MFS family permease
MSTDVLLKKMHAKSGINYQAWLNWVLGTAFVVFVFTFQTGYAITNLDMTNKLALTVTQVGIIGSIYTWAFAIAQFASGSILDKLGMRWVIPIACAIVTLGGFTFANANGTGMLIAGQILMAIGGSFGFVGAGFIGGKWFGPAKYGLMFAWVQFVSSLAAVIGQNTLGELAKQYSWDQMLNGLAFCGLIVTLLLFVLMRSPPQSNDTVKWNGFVSFAKGIAKKIIEVCSISDSWINALIGGATFGSMLGAWNKMTLSAPAP